VPAEFLVCGNVTVTVIVLAMKARRRSLLIALSVFLLLAAVWFGWSPREPVYEGRALSEWLDDLYIDFSGASPNPSEDDRACAKNAIREMGEDAIPMMVKMLKPESRFESWAKALVAKQSLVKFNFDSKDERRYCAAIGFEALGPRAKSAIPELVNYAEDANPRVRQPALHALGLIGAEAEVVVPVLQKALGDPVASIQGTSAAVLRFFGESARVAAPELMKCVNGGDRYAKIKAAETIAIIAPELATNTIPALAAMLNVGQPFEPSALRLLGSMGPAARAALPQIRIACESKTGFIRRQARETLKKIDPEARVSWATEQR
jgi:hypothetical protein